MFLQRLKNIFRYSVLIAIIVGCETSPKKLSSPGSIEKKKSALPNSAREIMSSPKLLNEYAKDPLTIIVDARPTFEYSLGHLRDSLSMPPEDFNQTEAAFKGLLDPDYYKTTRWLAKKGIAPDSQILVVGRGTSGEGEEGRIAWMLMFLGVNKVIFSSIDTIHLPRDREVPSGLSMEPIWKPDLQNDLSVEWSQVKPELKLTQKKIDSWVILDVRSENEYLGQDLRGLGKKSLDIGAMNVPWTEFFDSRGIIQTQVIQKLKSLGITENQKILVVSNKGFRSSAVLLALRMWGFKQASQLVGGYRQLMLSGTENK